MKYTDCQGCNMNRRKKKEVTIADTLPAARLLFKAVHSGDLREINRILRKERLPANVRDPDDPLSRTPLLVAAETQKYDVVTLLLKSKSSPADVNAESARGDRAIWGAKTRDSDIW